MFDIQLNLPPTPIVSVTTTDNRGRTVEEVAEACLNRLISVADTAPPAIKDQAMAFRDTIRPLLVFYMKEAVNSDRTTLYNTMRDAGHPDVAELIRRL